MFEPHAEFNGTADMGALILSADVLTVRRAWRNTGFWLTDSVISYRCNRQPTMMTATPTLHPINKSDCSNHWWSTFCLPRHVDVLDRQPCLERGTITDSLLAVCLWSCCVAFCFAQAGRVGNHPQDGRAVLDLFDVCTGLLCVVNSVFRYFVLLCVALFRALCSL